ncbi:MAG: DUF748 domain-containing protein [Bacteroidales bacterium]|nr:DUF748 domain-containing protein [Bacteroidales bacterium]
MEEVEGTPAPLVEEPKVENTTPESAPRQAAPQPEETTPDASAGKAKKRRKPLRRITKVLLWIVGSLVALFLLLAIFISPIAHWVIEKYSKQICGRVVTMEDLNINLFRGSVEMEGFVGLEQNDRDTFVAFDRLYVNMSLWRLLGKTVYISEITLENPSVEVIQSPGRFNFTDIIEFYKDDDDDDDEPSSWTVDLRNITVSKGSVVYRDSSVGSKFDLRQLAVKVPRIYFSTEDTDLGLDLKFADGGGLKVKLLYGMRSSEYDLLVKLTDFELNTITPYLRQFLNIRDFGGRLTTDLNLKGNTDHILDVVATGTAKFANLSMTDKSGAPVAQVGQVNLDIAEVNTMTGNFHLKRFAVSGAHFDYEQFGDHTNLDTFLGTDTTATSDAVAVADTTAATDTAAVRSKFRLHIDDLSMENSSFNYIDHTMRQEVRIPVKQISMKAPNFDLDGPLAVKLGAVVGDGGKLMADWSGSLSDFENMKLRVFLSNVPMTLASPYSVEYMAYPITDGVLSFVSDNTLTDAVIASHNKVDIYNCQVDKKIKEMKPEYNIPLRAGVYVLTDRKGNIRLDLPVSGNINDPTFSYRKIIFKTLANLFVKVLAAPVDFLVKAIGGDPDLFADMVYDIHPQGLGSESSDRLNKIAAAMQQKPELKLTIQQSVDMEENISEYALFNAKRDFYLQKHPGKQLGMEDFQAIQEIKPTQRAFVSYVNSRMTDTTSADIRVKCRTLYDVEQLRQQVEANVERRNQQVVGHLVSQGVAADRVEVLPLGKKKTPKGKTLLSFGIDMEALEEE